MAEGRLPIERTLILLDTNKFQGDEEAVELSFALKTKKDGGAFAANRTVQTLCVEGISEYCRIMYDVFPEDALVSVMTAGEETQRFNSWAAEQQCMKQIMDGFAGSSTSEATLGWISEALDQAVATLTEPLAQEGKPQYKNRTRLIVILQHQPSTSLYSFFDGAEEGEAVEEATRDMTQLLDTLIAEANAAASSTTFSLQAGEDEEDTNLRPRAIEHCELVLLRLRDVADVRDCTSHPPIKVSNHLTAYLHEVSPAQLPDVLSDLSILHFNLSVTGIPMKESSSDSTRAIYDVVLLHPMENQNPYACYFSTPRSQEDIVAEWAKTSHYVLGSHQQRLAHELVVQWKTTPKGVTAGHILSDKVVTLITPDQSTYQEGKIVKAVKASSPIPASHLLHAHHGDVFLRRLHAPLNCTEINLDRIYSVPLHNLRVKSLAQVVEANTHLRLSKLRQSNSKKQGAAKAGVKTRAKKKLEVDQMDLEEKQLRERPKLTHIEAPGMRYITTETMERMTRVFPPTKNTTLIFGKDRSKELKQLLRPFKHAFLQKENLSEDIKETVIESVTRLYQLSHANDIRVFPQFAGSQPNRKEAYRQLWLELLAYGERMSANAAHQQIIAAMRSLWPVDQPPDVASDATTAANANAQRASPAAHPQPSASPSPSSSASASSPRSGGGQPPHHQRTDPRMKVNDALKGRVRAKSGGGGGGKGGNKGKSPRPDRDRPEREGAGVKEWEGGIGGADVEMTATATSTSWQELERFENIEKLREKGREEMPDPRATPDKRGGGRKREREPPSPAGGGVDGSAASSVFNLFYASKQNRLSKKLVEFDGRLTTD
ncbi:uncharacterized protein ACA1_219080 [Acanthamoeba castellanii str. Neff]|uniref:Uncharacterized protein n=1 Tax=Acanthamoeba castellanii (strain ATCC 30010 / Neff) TaxID=1257118 RepID=L8GRE7_ACACF|nr:uncharacterized protein ACA1_219080 [Acanthamoeba castellanii str. Neff]ELR15223.1 hypothetical protein ACA1_219080 [Acanthamoeba castellanii str. Neff]